jgi:hypothetical protein
MPYTIRPNLRLFGALIILLALLLCACAQGSGNSNDSPGEGDPDTPETPDIPDSPELPTPVVFEWDPEDFDHVYDVGPGQPYADPSEIPWEALAPSSLVRIHHRNSPYYAKWVINTRATADDPVVVLGVKSGEMRPVISGEAAVTREELSYWNENRSVIKIGGSNLPNDSVVPAYIYVQSLDIRSARPPFTFKDDSGNQQTYASNAAAVHVEIGEQITIHDCLLHDAGNGLFSGHGSSNLLISGNYIYDNGNQNSIYHHNSYTESLGIVFEYNRYGPLRSGCLGNNLKDRSAGTVIRYNWIESGNRQLDLVETDYADLAVDPAYDTTFVYGNILIEPDGAGNSQILHYGGDGDGYYRKGHLYFYHNSVISTRSGNTTLVRMSTNEEHATIINNILYGSAGGSRFAVTSGRGQILLKNNWLPENWRPTHESGLDAGASLEVVANVEGVEPGFRDPGSQDYGLNATAADCLDAAAELPAAVQAFPVDDQYAKHTGGESRPDDGAPDLGAFEES